MGPWKFGSYLRDGLKRDVPRGSDLVGGTLEEYKGGGTRIRVCGCARLRITGLFL